MRVLCIDSRNRPNEIPINLWIEKGKEYTVIGVEKCNIQGGQLAYILAEIDLSGCAPYIGFSAHRFRKVINQPELQEVECYEN